MFLMPNFLCNFSLKISSFNTVTILPLNTDKKCGSAKRHNPGVTWFLYNDPPTHTHTLHTTVNSNYFKEERKSLKRLNSFHTVSSVNILSSVLHILISLLSEASSGSYLIAAKLISMVNYWSHQVASGFNCNIWNGSSTAMGPYFNIHLDYNAIWHCIKTMDFKHCKAEYTWNQH